ncbi:MAG TPA: carbohydrate ABC transporter permease [Tepidisphaeraceae bacterium]|nr:carbohydrate ABC transporter permease [Tepidisphaeraceae bacterium]
MNSLQIFLIILAAIFLILIPLSRSFAVKYARRTVLLLVAALMLMPFIWLICAAFKSTDAMSQYSFLPPPSQISAKTVNLGNFRSLLAPQPTIQGPVTFWRYVTNSLFLASAITVISLFFCSLGGYALAKYRFAGRNVIMIYMLASMTIPGVVLLAPNFEVIWRLGWMDTYKALIIPGAVGAFGIFLFRQAMLGVPNELIEAARIDGCNEFRIYLTLIMPLVRPMSGAFCLISFMGSWNAFLAPNIFLQSQNKLTLPVVLNQYMGTYVEHYGVFLAGTMLAMIPPAILFFALQREFISGLTSGAVKQ